MKSTKERVKGTDYVNSMGLIVHNLWRMRIYFILFRARDLSNQQAKKLVSLLALSRKSYEGKKPKAESISYLRDDDPDNIFS